MKGLVGVLLAAGSSRRFGGQKLLQPLEGEACIAVLSCRKLCRVTDHVVAIIRPRDAELAGVLQKEGAEVLECVDAHLGMGASLSFGVQASAEAMAWLVALADMPFIKISTLETLAAALRAGVPLVVPFHGEKRGHPVGFGSGYYPQLQGLEGDQGARSLLEDPLNPRQDLFFEDPGILLDIDTPEDMVLPFTHLPDVPSHGS